MSALTAWAWSYLLAVGAVIIGIWRVYASGKQSGRNQERASNAAQRHKNLERIKRADAARPSGRVQDDPHNHTTAIDDVCLIWKPVTYSAAQDSPTTVNEIRQQNAKRNTYCN